MRVPSSVTGTPSTRTQPRSMYESASRREHRPCADISLETRTFSIRALCVDTRYDANSDRFSNLDSVHRCRKDAARIAGAFARGIQPSRIDTLILRVALDTDRRRGSRLDSRQHGIIHCITFYLPIENGQRFAY